MPQPRRSATRKPAGAGAANRGRATAGGRGASRLLDPVHLVVLTRDRLQEVFDDAVRRGRLTRDDAVDLVGELLRRGRAGTDDVLADVEQLLSRARSGAGASAAADEPPFPIADYDDMTAAEIQSQLGDLAPEQLRRVRDYERRNANRKSVLQALERRLG